MFISKFRREDLVKAFKSHSTQYVLLLPVFAVWSFYFCCHCSHRVGNEDSLECVFYFLGQVCLLFLGTIFIHNIWWTAAFINVPEGKGTSET